MSTSQKNYIFVLLLIFMIILLFSFLSWLHQSQNGKEKLTFQALEGTEEDPFARQRFEWFRLYDPATGQIPRGIRFRELEFVQEMNRTIAAEAKVVTSNWKAKGPYNIGGRTRAVAIDIRDENIIFAGGVSGGMWKSMDGGKSWRKVTAPEQLQSVSCIAQNKYPGNENIWYYGTGESYPTGGTAAFPNFSNAFYRGDGIYKSIDNGESWFLLPSTSSGTPQVSDPFDYVFGLVTFGENGIFAATSNGLFKSIDGGENWEQALNFGENYRSTEIAETPGGTFYCTIGGIGPDNGVYRSDDGMTWEYISPPAWPDTCQRTAIGIAPSNENVVYFFSYLHGLKTKLWKYDRSAGWTDLTSNLPYGGDLITYGGHMMIVKVKPDDEDVLFLGTVGLYRSIDGGLTFEEIGGYSDFHVDQHAIVFYPSNPKQMIVGNDGGLFKTEDNLEQPFLDPRTGECHIHWESLNRGYVTTQFYSVAVDHGLPNSQLVLGGTQDNSFLYSESETTDSSWNAIFRGSMDGGFVAIADSGKYFYATQAGVFDVWRFEFPEGELRWTKLTPASIGGGGLWLTPFVLDPHDQKIMYLPWRNQLWRNSDLEEIPYVFPPVPTDVNWERLENVNGNYITALGMSEGEPRRLYYATYGWTEGGRLFKLDNPHQGQPDPVEITGDNFPYFPYPPSIGCITVDPRDANKVLVVFSNYGVINIYASDNGGASWVPVSGNLEEDPDGSGAGPSVRWVEILYVEDQPVYLAGTSMGLFSTLKLDSMHTIWTQEARETIGNIVVDMIDVRQSDGYIVVGTHGNGVYSTYLNKLPTGVENQIANDLTIELQPGYPNPFNSEMTISFSLPRSLMIALNVYNVRGEKVATLFKGLKKAGIHKIIWSAREFSSGLYFIRLESENYVKTQRVVLLK